MSVAYVRRHYGVPVQRGRRVSYFGKPGRITSADHRLRVRFDGEGFTSVIHPTEVGLIYLDGEGNPLWPSPGAGAPPESAGGRQMTAKWCDGTPANAYAGRGGHWYDPRGIAAPMPVRNCTCTDQPIGDGE